MTAPARRFHCGTEVGLGRATIFVLTHRRPRAGIAPSTQLRVADEEREPVAPGEIDKGQLKGRDAVAVVAAGVGEALEAVWVRSSVVRRA